MKSPPLGRSLVNPNQGHNHFPHNLRNSHVYFIHYQSEYSHGHTWPPNLLMIDPRMVIIFWARSSMSLRHMSFKYPYSEPHLTTYYLNIVVQVRQRNQIRHVYHRYSLVPYRSIFFVEWRDKGPMINKRLSYMYVCSKNQTMCVCVCVL